jgi:hypothetical protein
LKGYPYSKLVLKYDNLSLKNQCLIRLLLFMLFFFLFFFLSLIIFLIGLIERTIKRPKTIMAIIVLSSIVVLSVKKFTRKLSSIIQSKPRLVLQFIANLANLYNILYQKNIFNKKFPTIIIYYSEHFRDSNFYICGLIY